LTSFYNKDITGIIYTLIGLISVRARGENNKGENAMFLKKTQIIKFEQNLCNASINDNDVLFVRVSDIVREKNAMFEVPNTHLAYVIKGGGDGRIYSSGCYNVFDNKKEVKEWRKGFSVDIVYMPKDTSVPVRWGTPDAISYRDPESTVMLTITANGSFDITIDNPELFFRKIVGVKTEYDRDDFHKRVLGLVVSTFTDIFLNVVGDLRLTYDRFDKYKREIAEKIGKELSEISKAQLGVGIENFLINAINVRGTERIEEAIEEKLDIEKHSDENYRAYLQSKNDIKKLELETEKEKLAVENERMVSEKKKWEIEKEKIEQDRKNREMELEFAHKDAQLKTVLGIADITSRGRMASSKDGNAGVDLYNNAINSVVEFYVKVEDGSACGSGMLIDKEQHFILTNAHVVTDDKTDEPAKSIMVRFGDFKTRGKVLMLGDDKSGSGSGVDLALVIVKEVPQNAKEVQFRRKGSLQNGEEVYALGNARGEGTSITRGIVSDKDHFNGEYIMTDCPINHGNSGGPLFDINGNVIGVNTAIRGDSQNMGYAIPADTVLEFMEGKHCAKKYF